MKDLIRQHGLNTVVETGTFKGDMVSALLGRARRIVSIELDETLHREAKSRLRGAKGVELLCGDSGKLLPGVLRGLKAPALFWLDGHYTGPGSARTEVGSPIVAEIAALLAHPHPGHVVLIDDAREFGGGDGYPTIAELREIIVRGAPDAEVVVEDDIIRWTSRPRVS